MSASEQKIVQYLNEAHATEVGLVRVLQSQIAMTPRGSYRSGLETHLDETRRHAQRVQRRLGELGFGENPIQVAVGVAEAAIGQVLALAKTPLDLVRGASGEEKVLKNAKDACATEALEIATYTALERLARATGDEQTADLAASIRADEQKMLDRVLREIPRLADAVVGAEVHGDPGRTAKGAVASEDDLAIARYDKLTADEIVSRLSDLSQVELAKVDSYERRHQGRTTILERVTALRGNEPWPGYDELNVGEIESALAGADEERAKAVSSYERTRKNRAGVMKAAERTAAKA